MKNRRKRNLIYRSVLFLASVLFFSNSVISKDDMGIFRCKDDQQCSVSDMVDLKYKSAFEDLCKLAEIKIDEKITPAGALSVVEQTQNKFFNRKKNRERWEVSPLEWVNENAKQIFDDLLSLGYFDSILPQKNEYDAVCILGATTYAMKNRIGFVEELLNNGLKTGYIFLLTGERYLTPGVDGTAHKLSEVADYFGVTVEKLTEAHMFRYLFDKSQLSDKCKLIVIDTPQKDGCRPTTQTTVIDFLEHLDKNPKMSIKNVVFVSNQPSVNYQNAVISEIFHSQRSKLEFETVGKESLKNDESSSEQSIKDQDLQRALRELGASIWASMPQIFRLTNAEVDGAMTPLLKKLYGHQRMFYDGFFDNFS